MEQQTQPLTAAERERHLALLKRLDGFAQSMDSQFGVPGTRFRFGLDGLIGLIPVVGDAATTMLGLYPIVEAMRIKVPGHVLRRMGVNVGLDFLVGLVPLAGDVFDLAFKANQRNVALLRDYSQNRLQPPKPVATKSPLVWVMAALGAVLLTLVLIAL